MKAKTKWFVFRVAAESGFTRREKIPAQDETSAKARVRRIYPRAKYISLVEVSEKEALDFGFLERAHQTARKKKTAKAPGKPRPGKHGEPPEPENKENEAPPDCFQILGVSPASDLNEIKKAYRNLLRDYHPDKVASWGKNLLAQANKKTMRINRAYTEAVKLKKNLQNPENPFP